MEKIGTFFLKAYGWAYYSLPGFLRSLWGRTVGRLIYLLGYRKKIASENLQRAFPQKSPEEIDRILQRSYSNMGRLFSELPMVLGPMKQFCENRAEISGVEHVTEAKRKGKGVIIVSHHVGNWEVMVCRGALAGIDIMMVTKQLKPAWLHDEIEKSRTRYGVLATYEPRTMRDVLRHLKKNRTVGFILDQYAGPPIGVRVPLFGTPVGTAMAPALIAKRTGCVVLPATNYRKADGTFQVTIHAPFEWIDHPEPSEELAKNTAQYVKWIEGEIYAHPEQWLWTHRRFKGDLSPLRPDEWSLSRKLDNRQPIS